MVQIELGISQQPGSPVTSIVIEQLPKESLKVASVVIRTPESSEAVAFNLDPDQLRDLVNALLLVA